MYQLYIYNIYIYINIYIDAIRSFERCLQMNYQDSDARISIALAKTELGLFNEAIACYESIVADCPGVLGE